MVDVLRAEIVELVRLVARHPTRLAQLAEVVEGGGARLLKGHLELLGLHLPGWGGERRRSAGIAGGQ